MLRQQQVRACARMRHWYVCIRDPCIRRSLERRTDDGVTRFATLNADAVFNEMSLALPGSGSPTVNAGTCCRCVRARSHTRVCVCAVSFDDTLLYYIDASSLGAGYVHQYAVLVAECVPAVG
jgi:hypothetical protein